MRDDRFTVALGHLGHVYTARGGSIPDRMPERIRHVARVYLPTGDVLPICGADPTEGQIIGCRALWLDTNCPKCREIQNVPAQALTKRTLMVDLINSNITIEQIFLDAMYWNFHNADEKPINPDPDGVLAKAWLDNQRQITQMMARFQPTMERHEGRFNWPTDLELPSDRV